MINNTSQESACVYAHDCVLYCFVPTHPHLHFAPSVYPFCVLTIRPPFSNRSAGFHVGFEASKESQSGWHISGSAEIDAALTPIFEFTPHAEFQCSIKWGSLKHLKLLLAGDMQVLIRVRLW